MVSLIQTGATQIDATTMLAVLDIQASKNTYAYSRLPEGNIRILKLQPHRDKAAPLECKIIDYPLQDLYKSNHHLYDALSYAWGSPKKARFISIGNCRLPITISLHDALLRLRDCFLERIIWVDAICINQKDTEERNNQVQRMAMIYAMANRVIVWLGEAEDNSDQALEEIHKSADGQPTKDDKEIQNAILKLLQRAWFKRIWVLQEVAAARNVLILCGPMEIDGYVFCIGINSLEITYESNPNLRNLIQSATYLIRRRVFPPTQAISKPGEFSLNIAPLGELIDMYHAREASDCRDKIYALLGMSSDNSGSGSLSPDYDIRWGTLFQQVIKRIICERVLISTWQDKEVAVIKSKGCILGQVSSVKSDATWGDRQNVTISKYVPEWNPKKAIRSRYPQDQSKDENIFWTLTLQALANSIQRGDIVCLLQGASKPTIIRPYKDCFAIIAIAVNPITDKRAEKASNSWIKVLESATDFPRNLLLVWNWTKSLSENGGDDKYLMSSQIFKDGKPTQLMEMGLVLSDLKNYGKAAEILKRAIEIYEMEFEDEYSYTIAAMTHLAAVYKALGLFGEEEKWGVMADIMSGKGTEGMVIYLISSNDVEVKKFCLNWRWDQVTITEDIIKVAAAKSKGVMKSLLDRRGDQIIITDDIIKIAAAKNWGVMKLLLERRGDQIAITEDIIKAAASKSRSVMKSLLDRQGDQITITEDIIKAASENRDVMELLLDQRGDQITLTEDIVKVAAAKSSDVMELLLNRRGHQITITEDIVKVAALKNWHMINLLLDRRSDQITITEDIAKAIAGNGQYGEEVIKLLLNRLSDQITITENIIKAAAENMRGGRKIIELLLSRRGDQVAITEDIVKTAALNGNTTVMELLLDWRGDQIIITEDIVKAAAENKSSTVMELLLNRRGDQIMLTEDIVKAAAANNYSTVMMILIFHWRITITEDIVKVAAGNQWGGREMMEVLLTWHGDQIAITEDIVKTAASNWNSTVIELLLNKRGDQIFITEDIVKAAAGNEWGGREVMELLLNWRRGLIIITEDIIKAAVRNKISGQAVIKLLLDRRGGQIAITENIIKVAAESNREVMELLLHRQRYQNIVTEGIVNK